jgi:hypothetical protein
MDQYVSASTSARRRRVLAGAGAVALAVTSIGLVAAPAGAKAPPKPNGKTVCSTVQGTVAGTIQLTNCVDSGSADTGGSTIAFPTLNLAAGGVFVWTSGKTTTTGTPLTTVTKATKCPGYVKVKKTDPPVPEPAALKVTSAVISDTAGMKVPGKVKGAVCISADGTTVTALKPFKIN